MENINLPKTIKNAIAQGWIPDGDETTSSPDESVRTGTATLRHPDHQAMGLEFDLREHCEFSNPRFRQYGGDPRTA